MSSAKFRQYTTKRRRGLVGSKFSWWWKITSSTGSSNRWTTHAQHATSFEPNLAIPRRTPVPPRSTVGLWHADDVLLLLQLLLGRPHIVRPQPIYGISINGRTRILPLRRRRVAISTAWLVVGGVVPKGSRRTVTVAEQRGGDTILVMRILFLHSKSSGDIEGQHRPHRHGVREKESHLIFDKCFASYLGRSLGTFIDKPGQKSNEHMMCSVSFKRGESLPAIASADAICHFLVLHKFLGPFIWGFLL